MLMLQVPAEYVAKGLYYAQSSQCQLTALLLSSCIHAPAILTSKVAEYLHLKRQQQIMILYGFLADT
jgi:hypothetical protein